MKKMIFLPLVACLCSTMVHADGDLDLYGRFFLIGHYSDTKFDSDMPTTGASENNNFDEDGFQIYSHKSVMGIKGSEALSDVTDVTYDFEVLVDIDGDSEDTFVSRTNYLGVKNDRFGELRVGKHFSTVDLMNNVSVSQGYWDNLGETSLSDGDEVAALNMADAPPRAPNVVLWLSPDYDDMPFEFALMYQSKKNMFDYDNEDNNYGDGYGGYAIYNMDNGLTASVGYDDDIDIDGGLLRGTLSYDVSELNDMPLTVGFLYQQADYDYRSTKEKGYIFSAEMDVDHWSHPATVYAQYNNSSDLDGVDNADSQQLVLGGTYDFTESFVLHAYAGYNWANDVNRGTLTTTDVNGNDTDIPDNGDSHVFAIGGGMQYYF